MSDLTQRNAQRLDQAAANYSDTQQRRAEQDALTPQPAFSAGFRDGKLLVKRPGQNPIAVGEVATNGAIGQGQRVVTRGNQVDAMPRVLSKPAIPAISVPTTPPNVKYTWSVRDPNTDEIQIWVGGWIRTPKVAYTLPAGSSLPTALSIDNYGGDDYGLNIGYIGPQGRKVARIENKSLIWELGFPALSAAYDKGHGYWFEPPQYSLQSSNLSEVPYSCSPQSPGIVEQLYSFNCYSSSISIQIYTSGGSEVLWRGSRGLLNQPARSAVSNNSRSGKYTGRSGGSPGSIQSVPDGSDLFTGSYNNNFQYLEPVMPNEYVEAGRLEFGSGSRLEESINYVRQPTVETESRYLLDQSFSLSRISRDGNRSVGSGSVQTSSTAPPDSYQFFASRPSEKAGAVIQKEPIDLTQTPTTGLAFPWVDVGKAVTTIDRDRYISASTSNKFYESAHSAEVQFYDAKLKKSKKVNVRTYGIPAYPAWASYHE